MQTDFGTTNTSPDPVRQLQQLGQSIWFDYIRRDFIESGELRRLVDASGVTGVTANPSIFEKAILESTLKGAPSFDREALLKSRGCKGRSHPAVALGEHEPEESSVPRRVVCRGAHRPRHDQHDHTRGA